MRLTNKPCLAGCLMVAFGPPLLIIALFFVPTYALFPPILPPQVNDEPIGFEGPFFGLPCDVPSRKPDSVYRLYSEMRLESYGSGDCSSSAIVALKSREGNLLWCKKVVHERPAVVYKIEFEYSCGWRIVEPVVIGKAYVTDLGGLASTEWFITREGVLKGYYIARVANT